MKMYKMLPILVLMVIGYLSSEVLAQQKSYTNQIFTFISVTLDGPKTCPAYTVLYFNSLKGFIKQSKKGDNVIEESFVVAPGKRYINCAGWYTCKTAVYTVSTTNKEGEKTSCRYFGLINESMNVNL